MGTNTKDQQIANQQSAIVALKDDLAGAKADIARAAEVERTLKMSLAESEARHAAAEIEAANLRQSMESIEATMQQLQHDLVKSEQARVTADSELDEFDDLYHKTLAKQEAAERELEQAKAENIELHENRSRKVDYLEESLAIATEHTGTWQYAAVCGWGLLVGVVLCWVYSG